MAISPQDGSIATAFNVRGDTHVYLYDSELDKQLAIWTLPRYVQDLAWSRNGKQLAVLFNGRFDGKRRDLGRGFVAPVHEPDVWIVDPYSGVASVKFWTGSNQSRVKYSRDSGLLYVINDFYYVYPGQRGAITVFSSAMGERIRTISGGPRGVHSNFSLSADGRLIAADASTEVPQRLHLEPIYGAKIARVVLLDARTGELLFEYHEKTDRDTSDPLPLAFSEDGRFLFVDFPLSREKPYEHIEVFSLTESK